MNVGCVPGSVLCPREAGQQHIAGPLRRTSVFSPPEACRASSTVPGSDRGLAFRARILFSCGRQSIPCGLSELGGGVFRP